MYLMYVDESGDPGTHKFSSPHFILSGLIISQNDWRTYLSRLKIFRKSIKEKYGLNQRTEIHASELIRVKKIKEYLKISKTNRIKILGEYCAEIPSIFDSAKIINVCLDISKFETTEEVQSLGYERLIQRYDNYLKKVAKDKGIIITDDLESNVVMQQLRKMRIYNPMKSHFSETSYNAPTDSIIEDMFPRKSHHSYFIQTVDVVAHTLYRKEYPKGSLRKHNVHMFFDRIKPVLLLEATKYDDLGIVRK